MSFRVHEGDCADVMAELEPESVQCVVTSPPYWGLRDYGVESQLGLETTVEDYVQHLVDVFDGVHRLLDPSGTAWLVLGDRYATKPRGSDNGWDKSRLHNPGRIQKAQSASLVGRDFGELKPKDLVGVPWLVAFALRARGWWLRADIIWAKPNPQPESITDRPTKTHEHVFLLTKSARYKFDQDAVRTALVSSDSDLRKMREGKPRIGGKHVGYEDRFPAASAHTRLGQLRSVGNPDVGRNIWDVWTIATEPYPGAHFATFPTRLVQPCVRGGSGAGDTVLDPFCGSGTVGVVSLREGRSFIGIELNPTYAEMARHRIRDDAPLFNEETVS